MEAVKNVEFKGYVNLKYIVDSISYKLIQVIYISVNVNPKANPIVAADASK